MPSGLRGDPGLHPAPTHVDDFQAKRTKVLEKSVQGRLVQSSRQPVLAGSTRTSTSASATRAAGPTRPSSRTSDVTGSDILHSNFRLAASLLEETASQITRQI